MDTGTIIRAINNLPSPTKEGLLGRIAEMVVEALAADGQGPKAAKRTGAPKANRVGRKAPSAAVTEEAVLAHIKSNPEQRSEQIAAALGGDVKVALKKLREAKLIRGTGQRRAMAYSVVAGGKKS